MQWLNKIVDELTTRHPSGEITVSSGVSPSGAYHVGTLREIMTAEIVARELRRRGREVRHIHVSDDLDVFRKVPVGIPDSYSEYLGKPLCDIPAPDGSDQSYADFYVSELPKIIEDLRLDMEVIRAHEKYRSGFFVPTIETTLTSIENVKKILIDVSGHKLNDDWSPVQVIESGYLKNRKFTGIDTEAKTIDYIGSDGQAQSVSYAHGEVKLNWRIDWPARWALLGVQVEPFGRDHATRGGSYDTGEVIAREIFKVEAPYPIPYNFINRTGETKKMSKSGGDTVTATQLLDLMPSEIIWYFMLKFPPEKQLFFDTGATFIRLVDEFSELLAKPDKTPREQQMVELCMVGIDEQTVSNIPFSHLLESYQASLKDEDKTIEVIGRTEHADTAKKDREIIKKELRFIDRWLRDYADEEIKFDLRDTVDATEFSDVQKQFLSELAGKITEAPEDADGEWFHLAIYSFKETLGLGPKELFGTLYQLLIGKSSGPRAGWFLSLLPKDWLIDRLRLQR